jgi:hypothetical protein
MTRAQRALACAVGIVPNSVAGIALLRCGCSTAAWALEVVTARGVSGLDSAYTSVRIPGLPEPRATRTTLGFIREPSRLA